jgi:hypothetical protein
VFDAQLDQSALWRMQVVVDFHDTKGRRDNGNVP